ncbi:Tigger transposable element-derived protein 6 [Dictyocoela muelleri]|nr:Tigger transposable element-derived protein 6 [Dictyocoela muelleri]
MKKLSKQEMAEFENDVYNGKISERKLAKKYKISKGSVFRIKKELKNSLEKPKINNFIPKEEKQLFKTLDDQMFEVFLRLRADHVPVNGKIIKMIAKRIANRLDITTFKASNGWIENFKKRHDLTFKNISGESNSADMTSVESFKTKFRKKVDEFKAENIFNCDETALYYKNPPRKSFVTPDDNCKGSKSNKMRLTIMLTCSMSGEKLNPLVIGKVKNPRPMKFFNPEEVGVDYTSSSKAWMTTFIFKKYLNNLNENMKEKKRKILLILDNAPSHPIIELSHIELLFLPRNTTSILQPLDMGIIKAFKCHYFNVLIDSCYFEKADDNIDLFNSTNIKDAIIMISIAWDFITKESIVKCFTKGLLISSSINESKKDEQNLETLLDKRIDEVFDEFIEDEELEDIQNEGCREEPICLIRKALKHFNIFYSAAKQLPSTKLKELLLLKISITKEWKKTFDYGNKITDYLEYK